MYIDKELTRGYSHKPFTLQKLTKKMDDLNGLMPGIRLAISKFNTNSQEAQNDLKRVFAGRVGFISSIYQNLDIAHM